MTWIKVYIQGYLMVERMNTWDFLSSWRHDMLIVIFMSMFYIHAMHVWRTTKENKKYVFILFIFYQYIGLRHSSRFSPYIYVEAGGVM